MEELKFILAKFDPWALILSIVLTIVWLMLLEGIIKPLIAYQTQRLARRFLPIVFDKLDPIMPSAIANLSPVELEQKIFNEFLGLGLTEAQSEELTREFDRRFSIFVAAQKVKENDNA